MDRRAFLGGTAKVVAGVAVVAVAGVPHKHVMEWRRDVCALCGMTAVDIVESGQDWGGSMLTGSGVHTNIQVVWRAIDTGPVPAAYNKKGSVMWHAERARSDFA